MNFDRYIARRMNRTGHGAGNEMSRPAVRVAITGMTLGLAVMLIAIAVVIGFKREVRDQVIGFGGHIQLNPYDNIFSDNALSYVNADSTLIERLKSVDGVKHVEPIASIPGILKTETDFKGVVLKGVDANYNWRFFSNNLKAGEINNITLNSNDVIISNAIAKMMKLNVGDEFLIYFMKDQLRVRKLNVAGIYETSFNEYDAIFIIGNCATVQKLNGWTSDTYSTIEIITDDYSAVNKTVSNIYTLIGNLFADGAPIFKAQTIEEIAPAMFDWLDMLDINAVVILTLMVLVSGFCMISGLLIIILERRQMIGIFKSIGANDWTIRRIFLWQSAYMIGRGMMIGNIIGLLLILVEYKWHIIPLDPVSYYVSYVPVYMDFKIWALLNIGVMLTSLFMMIAPTYLTTRIAPAEAMRFD